MGLGAGTSGVGTAGDAAGSLDLLVPGLLGPIRISPEDVPAAPVLTRLLSRGTPLSGGRVGLVDSLFAAFGMASSDIPPGMAPSAPFCHLADVPRGRPSGCLLHADPIHLRLDRDHLLLYDARHLDLAQTEADTLAALFNAHFASDGLILEAPVPGRWYLQVAKAPRLSTWPLDAVVGRSVAPFLPAGEDARRWLGITNEVQMLFAQAEVNRRREAEGRLPVSGIWLWGAGRLSGLHPQARHQSVFADHPLAIGLARQAGVARQPLAKVEGGLTSAVAKGPVLVVWDRLWPAVLDADPVAWVRELAQLEHWLGRAQKSLAYREPRHWTLDGCNGNPRRIARLDAWRLWRRLQPLATMLDVA